MWLGNRFNVWLSESQKRTKRDLNVLPLLSFSILNFCQTNPHHPSRCCIMLSISLCYSPVLKRESTGWLQKYLCSNWNNWPFSSKITVTVVPKKSFNMSYLGCSLHVHIWFWVLCSYSATICGYQAKREGKSLLFFKFIPLLWWDSFSVYHRLRWRKREFSLTLHQTTGSWPIFISPPMVWPDRNICQKNLWSSKRADVCPVNKDCWLLLIFPVSSMAVNLSILGYKNR